MEFRTGDVIINVDRKLNGLDESFIKGQAHFIMAVLLAGQTVEAMQLMLPTVETLMTQYAMRKSQEEEG